MSARYLLLMLLPVALAACTNSAQLRYQPDKQPDWLHVYADYQILQDHIGVLIDTDGRHLDDVYITKPDGAVVRPLSITYPAFGQSVSVGTGIGWGPVGVGVGVPVGPKHAEGLTTATFSQQAVGPEPWMLTFKLKGAKDVTVKLGGSPTAK
jgi:hypothetical protein